METASSDRQVAEIRALVATEQPALSLQLRALAWIEERRLALRRAWARFRALPAAVRSAERNAAAIAAVEDTLDALGVPRERHEQTFSPVERLHLFVDRLSGRLATQVDNNMLYFNACKEAIVLLEGSPNSGNFRTRQAIAKLRAITTPAGSPSSLILPS
jgi:hypothetical protein